MVMVRQVVAAGGGDGLELVVGKGVTEVPTGGGKGIKELIVRVVHLIDTKHGFQTSLVKRLIVSHKWQTINQRFYLLPYLWEDGRFIRIFMA